MKVYYLHSTLHNTGYYTHDAEIMTEEIKKMTPADTLEITTCNMTPQEYQDLPDVEGFE